MSRLKRRGVQMQAQYLLPANRVLMARRFKHDASEAVVTLCAQCGGKIGHRDGTFKIRVERKKVEPVCATCHADYQASGHNRS